ncbi:major facilitator superfamily domain-containing protein [Mycena rosella]|uniref:Major facilitator superfamily domain-containing protein n=1 Tax=Mycena rosella TaxID=1033263 RepID=A0AAD7GVZ6_MYCRO|nr:major facilitator superfamily domain-containing protein [Mycena rosella]
MISSLLFVGTTCGFTAGTLLVPRIMRFLGRFYLSDANLALVPIAPFRIALSRKTSGGVGHSASQARYLVVIMASVCFPTNFIMMGSKTGFATMFMGYVIVAFGRAVLTGIFTRNMFLSDMPSRPLGYAFGLWGLGAVASPLVFQATAAAGLPWTHFYFGSLVLAAFSFVFLGITFMPTAREFAMDRKTALNEAESRSAPPTPGCDPDSTSSTASTGLQAAHPNQLRLVSSMPYQWAVSLFVLFYCGSETTTQGLIVQYLLAERSADRNTVGYVSAGFWAGVSASRLAWSYWISFTRRKYIIQGCLSRWPGVALGMQLFIWFIDSSIENAVSTALIGVFFGPLFPACLELANDLLPAEVNMISMAIVYASSRMLTIAIFPFITGVVTTKYSMRTWSYITVAQAAILLCTWSLFPTRQPLRRTIAA